MIEDFRRRSATCLGLQIQDARILRVATYMYVRVVESRSPCSAPSHRRKISGKTSPMTWSGGAEALHRACGREERGWHGESRFLRIPGRRRETNKVVIRTPARRLEPRVITTERGGWGLASCRPCYAQWLSIQRVLSAVPLESLCSGASNGM